MNFHKYLVTPFVSAGILLLPALSNGQTIRLNDAVTSASDGVHQAITDGSGPALLMTPNAAFAAIGGQDEQVYAIALIPVDTSFDEAGVHVLAASTSFYKGNENAANSRNIYCIDGNTGAVSLFADLNTGDPLLPGHPGGGGIGGLVYNPGQEVVYASDINTGRIYSLPVSYNNGTGCPVGVTNFCPPLDPFGPYNFAHPTSNATIIAAAGFSERIEGLGFNLCEARVYWGRHRNDAGRPAKNGTNDIYSSPLDGSGCATRGTFQTGGFWTLEAQIPNFSSNTVPPPMFDATKTYSGPPMGIEFNYNGSCANGDIDMLVSGFPVNGPNGLPLPTVGAGVYEFAFNAAGYPGGGTRWMTSAPGTVPPDFPTGDLFLAGPNGRASGGGGAYLSTNSEVIASTQNLGGSLSGWEVLSANGGGLADPGTVTIGVYNAVAATVMGDLEVCTTCPARNDGIVCPDGSTTPDSDGDGVPDSCDNCPSDVNTAQEDLDTDGIGDICDAEPTVPIPTMGEWFLILFGAIILIAGVVVMRRTPGTEPAAA